MKKINLAVIGVSVSVLLLAGCGNKVLKCGDNAVTDMIVQEQKAKIIPELDELTRIAKSAANSNQDALAMANQRNKRLKAVLDSITFSRIVSVGNKDESGVSCSANMTVGKLVQPIVYRAYVTEDGKDIIVKTIGLLTITSFASAN